MRSAIQASLSGRLWIASRSQAERLCFQYAFSGCGPGLSTWMSHPCRWNNMTRFVIQLLILPLVVVGLPLMFSLAWIGEFIEDLSVRTPPM